jgi:hypothetical protein
MPCFLRDATRQSRRHGHHVDYVTNKSNVGEQDTKDGIRSTIWTYKKGAWEFDAKDGMMWALIVMLLVMWRCVLLTLYLGNARILTDGGQEVGSEINEPPPRHRH